jgi:hypothetical protein
MNNETDYARRDLLTKISNHPVRKIGEFEFVVEQDQSIGMNFPVKMTL